MNKTVLYRKQLELLAMAKQEFSAQSFNLSRYIHSVRDAIPDLFYESQFNLKQDFIELIPVDKLCFVRQLLDNLKLISGGGGNEVSTNSSMFKTADICNQISELESIIKTQISLHSSFTVFYSWQNDTDKSINRNFIENAIKKSIEELNKTSEIKLAFDKDTRDQAGSPDIFPTIRRKIDGAICFIADVTSICKINKEQEEKEISNPNVMCELGYALSSLSDERIIIICNTYDCNIKNLPFDLGQKRTLTYCLKPSDSKEQKSKIKSELANDLQCAIKAIRDL